MLRSVFSTNRASLQFLLLLSPSTSRNISPTSSILAFTTMVDLNSRMDVPSTDREYPLTLTTGRVLYHYHTGTMTRRSPTLTTQLNEGYAEVSFEDAAALGISGGETVRVISRRGEIFIKARITHIIPAGTVFIPFHFAEAAANVLTSGSSLDPLAKIPELKVCAIRIEKAV